MRKNWRATLVQTSVSLTSMITERQSFYWFRSVLYIRLPRVKSLFSVSFTGNWFSISRSGSDTHREASVPAFLLLVRPFEEIVCHVLSRPRPFFHLACPPRFYERSSPSSRSIETLLDNLGEIASFHSPMKILWATCSNRAWSEKYILPPPFRKLFFYIFKEARGYK